MYDVVIVGAGVVGSAIARELSRFAVSVLVVEAADDVAQAASKGNSGVVHAGYNEEEGSVRARHCWPGNQSFPALDRELRFGFRRNGALVVAADESELVALEMLKRRGERNGVKNLRILNREETLALAPSLAKTDGWCAALSRCRHRHSL